eukprot:1577182-Rhodomonas_salina.1
MEEGFSVGPEDICADPDPSLVSDFCSLLGSALFAACWSRPDASLSVTKLARYTTCCTPKLFAALKRVLRYLISTKERGITWTS